MIERRLLQAINTLQHGINFELGRLEASGDFLGKTQLDRLKKRLGEISAQAHAEAFGTDKGDEPDDL